MRHLLLIPVACITLAACAGAPGVLPSAGPFTLEPGGSAEVMPGLTLSFDAADDSRCPPGVRCVWAGKLVYRFSIRQDGAALEEFTLSPAQPEAAPKALNGRRIVLDADAISAPAAEGKSARHRAILTLTLTAPDSSTPPKTP
ncbi:hypothetical protein [Massilia sp. Leaf139]|uniref:hypothetical protein n=1 Tax=Massilia sp. Leaf139 TaxID=1736272 RepID=UPI0006F43BA5|nr:hypothetical protein [Massilia sp. Leaf139]KQQ91823.1 hypothetical protein ASF77_07790 [Massilia sp. Leaf139]